MEGEAAAAASNEQIRQISVPIYQARVWMKLVGVLSIIQGILVAFTIIGIVVAWLPIWMGVLLFQSASRAEDVYVSGDLRTMIDSLAKIRTYFTIMGIVTLIMVVFMMFVIFIGIGGAFLDLVG